MQPTFVGEGILVADSFHREAAVEWTNENPQMRRTWEGLPKPAPFVKALKGYYPDYKDDIIYIGRGIIALIKGDKYYIIGEVTSEKMDVEDFLEDTNLAEQFSEFNDIVSYILTVYIYNKLKPNMDKPF